MRLALFSCLWLCSAPLCAQNRVPAVAGQFYPEDPAELSRAVDAYLAQAPAPAKALGSPLALIVPHAGYEYSAPVAAVGYKTVSGAYDTVVVLGSAHHVAVPSAALYAKGAFETPLGQVPIDEDMAALLFKETGLFSDMPRAHEREHSIEVQLPFLLKRLKPGWKLLPIVMNTEDPRIPVLVGEALAAAAKGRKVLFVASSDLSHYPPAEVADKVDRSTLKALEGLDPELFWLSNRLMMARREPGLVTAWCGEAAVLATMSAARSLGANKAALLSYANSGASPHGDKSRAVGYAAVALVRSTSALTTDITLSEAQKKTLLGLARETVTLAAEGKRPEVLLLEDPTLNLPSAVFVTLTKDGRLRGCIGTTEPRGTLRDAVAAAAYSAALEDNRFTPVTKDEAARLHIEISLLSRAEPVAGQEKIIPRKHGVILSQGGRSGLFLPQVWEQIPEKEGFLSELCGQKAGLPRDCWKDPKTSISVFTVSSFKG